jgi:hypothetical protein
MSTLNKDGIHMKTKKPKDTLYRYFIVPLEALMQHPHLIQMIWPINPEKWVDVTSMLYHSYAISENHPNISIIPVYVEHGTWMNLGGTHDDVRPMI